MSSDAQIRANQANALLSSGPRSEEGKARTRLNSQTHGLRSKAVLLPGEDLEEFTALEAALYEECQPVGQQEEFCISQMVQSQWRLRRISQLEAGAFATGMPDQKQLSLMLRYENSLTRAYYKASKELRELQKNRATAELAAAKAEEAAELEDLDARLRSFIFAPMPRLPRSVKESQEDADELASLGNLDGEDLKPGTVPFPRSDARR